MVPDMSDVCTVPPRGMGKMEINQVISLLLSKKHIKYMNCMSMTPMPQVVALFSLPSDEDVKCTNISGGHENPCHWSKESRM